MNILRIDTTDSLRTKIELEVSGKTSKLDKKRISPSEQDVLELIEKILKKQNFKLKDINSLEVNTGPGSFTGLRVGMAIANALSFALNLSINGKQVSEIELPKY